MHTDDKLEDLKGSDHLKYTGLRKRIILKRILIGDVLCSFGSVFNFNH
jgi:hypothetical protein